MKIKYKHQRFQAEATRCVTDVFQGQPKSDGLSNFLIDQGKDRIDFKVEGFGNAPIVLDRESLCEEHTHHTNGTRLEANRAYPRRRDDPYRGNGNRYR